MLYLEEPTQFINPIVTAGCHIVVGDEVLFLKRAKEKSYGETWCVPSGKVEGGESPLEGVLREVQEETGITLRKEQVTLFRPTYVVYVSGNFHYYIFGAHLHVKPSVTVNQREHTEYRWMTVEEALQEPLIEDEDRALTLYFGI